MKRRRLTEQDRIVIKEQYTKHYARMIDLAKQYRVTRQCIFKVLNRLGVDTTKEQRIERTCRTCGKTVLRRRGMVRKTKYSYCNEDCYITYLETLGEDYKPSSYWSRAARKIILEGYPGYNPQLGHVLHHINKDCTDNRLCNLAVYACQGDHLKAHRGQDIQPIWRGA